MASALSLGTAAELHSGATNQGIEETADCIYTSRIVFNACRAAE
jgi:hypothetical protein